jgi:hypothetical protein
MDRIFKGRKEKKKRFQILKSFSYYRLLVLEHEISTMVFKKSLVQYEKTRYQRFGCNVLRLYLAGIWVPVK